MKKLILILGLFLAIGCSSDDDSVGDRCEDCLAYVVNVDITENPYGIPIYNYLIASDCYDVGGYTFEMTGGSQMFDFGECLPHNALIWYFPEIDWYKGD